MTERVLIIEDEKRWCDFLSLLIRQGGWEPLAVTDPEQGLQLLSQQEFDLLLTDLRMPKIDGIQVLKTVKAEKPGPPRRLAPDEKLIILPPRWPAIKALPAAWVIKNVPRQLTA